MKEKKKANAVAEPGEAKGKKGKKKKAGEPKEVKVEPAKDAVDDSTPSGDTAAKAIEEVVTEAQLYKNALCHYPILTLPAMDHFSSQISLEKNVD